MDFQYKSYSTLKNYNLIYFGPEKWSGLWRSRHQLMYRFSKFNKILYVEPEFYLKNIRFQLRHKILRWEDIYRDLKRKRITEVYDNLHIYHSPLFLPVSNRFPLDKISTFLWIMFVKLAMLKLDIKKPILWLSKPEMVSYIDKFDEKLVLYHVVDEYSAYSGVSNEQRLLIEKFERKMLGKSDIVIVVSKSLYYKKKRHNRYTYLIPNGVDYNAYEKALNSNRPSPRDIFEIAKPIIGYSGLIAAKLDLELIKHVAKLHPEWSIVLIGSINEKYCRDKIKNLKSLKNVYFLGQKNIELIPYYIKAFDICILPYIVNEHSENISPLKLYDYLAAGKPIVSTNIRACRMFNKVLKIAFSKEEFNNYIEQLLFEKDVEVVKKRQLFAKNNTWENRINRISRLIYYHLRRKQTGYRVHKRAC